MESSTTAIKAASTPALRSARAAARWEFGHRWGSVGDAYDNAMAESFFASLECELIDRRSFQSHTEARIALFTWIEGWYNPRRRHSALTYLPPINYERSHAARSEHQPPRPGTGLTTVGSGVAGATPPVDNPAVANA